MSKPTFVMKRKKVCAGRPRALRLSANWKTSAAASPPEFPATMTVESDEPVKIFLFCFSSHPLAKISHQRELSHGYYRMGDHEISTSRSLDMIGKISLVMWLHFNQSYSKNLSMWDIISIISHILRFLLYDWFKCSHMTKDILPIMSSDLLLEILWSPMR